MFKLSFSSDSSYNLIAVMISCIIYMLLLIFRAFILKQIK